MLNSILSVCRTFNSYRGYQPKIARAVGIFIALALYRPTFPPATSCPYMCVLEPQALHRVFAMNATHDLQLC